MATNSDLFETVISNLLNGDQIEAVYTLKALADEIEEHGMPNHEDMVRIMASFLEDEDEDYRKYIPTDRFDDHDFENNEEEIGSLFDSIDDD